MAPKVSLETAVSQTTVLLSVVICQGFRDLLSPADSGSVIIDREPGEP